MRLDMLIERLKAEMLGYEQSWRKYIELWNAGQAGAKEQAHEMKGRVVTLSSVIDDLRKVESIGEETKTDG